MKVPLRLWALCLCMLPVGACEQTTGASANSTAALSALSDDAILESLISRRTPVGENICRFQLPPGEITDLCDAFAGLTYYNYGVAHPLLAKRMNRLIDRLNHLQHNFSMPAFPTATMHTDSPAEQVRLSATYRANDPEVFLHPQISYGIDASFMNASPYFTDKPWKGMFVHFSIDLPWDGNCKTNFPAITRNLYKSILSHSLADAKLFIAFRDAIVNEARRKCGGNAPPEECFIPIDESDLETQPDH